MMINMHEDKFDPKTKKDLLDQNQRSFMSDTIDDTSRESETGIVAKC